MPYHAKTIVVGCGNILFKDDGFGPIVVNLLEKYFENETEDDFDPMVISYIDNEFSKEVLDEVEDIVRGVDLTGEVKFIDAGNGATHLKCLGINMKMSIPGLWKNRFMNYLKNVKL